MDKSPERIKELPAKQVSFSVDTVIGDGGAIGFRVINDCTISMKLLFDSAAGVAMPFTSGETFIGRVTMISSNDGATVTTSDIVLFR